jgi:hypothetical protein
LKQLSRLGDGFIRERQNDYQTLSKDFLDIIWNNAKRADKTLEFSEELLTTSWIRESTKCAFKASEIFNTESVKIAEP